MILQALHGYYERKMRDPDPARRLPAAGLEEKEIPFILELALDGRLVGIKDTRTQEGKKKFARRYQVPQGVKKTSGVAANLLWDTAEYVLGLDTKGKPQRVAEQVAAFRQRVDQLAQRAPSDAGLIAVQRFLAGQPLADAQLQPQWVEIAEVNPIVSFRLKDDIDLVCQRPGVIGAVSAAGPKEEAPGAALVCLITGDSAEPERLHNALKGVWGAQTSGANIVSFNLDAFRSFGKEQGANAPVSALAAFAYTTALNSLLAKGSRQRMQVGDASTVFWAQSEQDSDFEDAFASFFDTDQDDPDAHTEQVRALFDALQSGQFDGATGQRKFYVLGLAPNAARISIRFWHAATLHDIAVRVREWFADLEITHRAHEQAFPPLYWLLRAIAVQGKPENIPPTLSGDLMRAILTGGPFPALWLNAAVQRSRAERDVTYYRAATIKACLNRQIRFQNPMSEEVYRPMLDLQNPNAGYRLGRLFATLEKIQEAASPGLNATIRERYFGAASSTPVAVFTTLLRLKNHHLAKLPNRGQATNFEKLIAEITSGLTDFPTHMALPDQGRFALGYYHQRQDFFTKTDANKAAAAAIAAETTESTKGD
ncbi:type I-C CRISPR-associated protein Cas8c/Csd1 [Sphaerotilus sp.]|uniref:type I-C CRISPR-associated protein Cas8c/Csd1 n=1 Tax=Sphaerotilus sp. TaxID=2093942 RepID=UPI00286DA9D7|nr:type I-C CRISPR-associated protein Cas8c/Csd1 [Sphaerotilus sp.]